MKIIVVEDEVRIREGIRDLIDMLEDEWEFAGEAENGEAGLELIRRERPDVVITDIRMAKMGGLDMLETARADGIELKAVVLSAYSEFEYARTAMKLGVTEYLLKPVSPNELMETMHNVMHRLEQKRFEQKLLSQKDEFGEKHDAVSQVNSLFVQSSNTIKSIMTDIAASLIKTGEKISDVCEKTGFNDQHYFSQMFKKTFGCTPSNYRNENGENFPGLYEILNSKSGNGK